MFNYCLDSSCWTEGAPCRAPSTSLLSQAVPCEPSICEPSVCSTRRLSKQSARVRSSPWPKAARHSWKARWVHAPHWSCVPYSNRAWSSNWRSHSAYRKRESVWRVWSRLRTVGWPNWRSPVQLRIAQRVAVITFVWLGRYERPLYSLSRRQSDTEREFRANVARLRSPCRRVPPFGRFLKLRLRWRQVWTQPAQSDAWSPDHSYAVLSYSPAPNHPSWMPSTTESLSIKNRAPCPAKLLAQPQLDRQACYLDLDFDDC